MNNQPLFFSLYPLNLSLIFHFVETHIKLKETCQNMSIIHNNTNSQPRLTDWIIIPFFSQHDILGYSIVGLLHLSYALKISIEICKMDYMALITKIF